MSRTIETTAATLTSEAVAPVITIRWNPVDDTGAVTFQVQRMESVDGVFQRLVPEADLSVSLEEFLTRTFVVGNTEVDGDLIQGYIKTAFDTLYVERAALTGSPETPATPE